MIFLAASQATLAQTTAADDTLAGSADTTSVGKIGRVQDGLRRFTLRRLLYKVATDPYGEYSEFKARIEKDTGLSWSMDLSYMQQWGLQDGGSPAGQWLAMPLLDWKLFDSAAGAGSLQLAYSATRYSTRQSAADVQGKLGLITPVNDYPERQNTFAQFTYTHALPGNKVSVTAGQYPFYNFDGNQYLANQQENFNNYVLAQNGSATYGLAGLGAYVQVNATSTIQYATGFQSANNITGATLSTRNFGDDGFSWFAYAQWTPAFKGLGAAQYSITYYEVPSVPAQSPKSHGWSLNAVQNLSDTWAVFARANRAYDYVTPIRASYALGAAMNDPLGRGTSDQIGLAFGYSDAAPQPTNPAGTGNEKLVEAYWNWTFAKGLLFSPGVQYIRDPALDPTRDSAWVLSLRTTLMF
ncbi:MAG: carbohydrate porin [Betaproteobacteria bacterium]|nr:carbohydrate porin [Betaproteobacteria bacterium]